MYRCTIDLDSYWTFWVNYIVVVGSSILGDNFNSRWNFILDYISSASTNISKLRKMQRGFK